MIAIERIMIPTDFSEYSNHALKYAVSMAVNFKAKLYLVHVYELPFLSHFKASIWAIRLNARAGERKVPSSSFLTGTPQQRYK